MRANEARLVEARNGKAGTGTACHTRASTGGKSRARAVSHGHRRRSPTWIHTGRPPARNDLLSRRSDAPAAHAVDRGASADPAGLTAKARPETARGLALHAVQPFWGHSVTTMKFFFRATELGTHLAQRLQQHLLVRPRQDRLERDQRSQTWRCRLRQAVPPCSEATALLRRSYSEG